MAVNHKSQNFWGGVLFVLGLVPIGIEFGRYWLMKIPIGPIPIIVGGVFCVGGAWSINSAKTKDFFQTVSSGSVMLIRAVRGGQRGMDRVSGPTQAIIIPDQEPAVKPPTDLTREEP